MEKTTSTNIMFQSIFEASIEGITTLNKEGKILFANPACEQLFGYKSGKLIGKNIEILIPEKLEQNHKIQIKIQKKAAKQETGLCGIRKDGSKFSLNVGLIPTVIDGKYAIILFFEDLTPRNKGLSMIEQKDRDLLEISRKYDALINNLDVIVFNCKNTKDFAVEFINKGCLEMTGYSQEEFETKKINPGDNVLEEDRDRLWDEIQKAIKEKKSYNVEYRLRHKNGNIKHVWAKGYGVYNDKNELVALEGFVNDITSIKETEIELRLSQTKTNALLEAIPDKMFVQNFEGDYIDWYAKNTEELLMPPKEFMGKNMKVIQPPQMYQKLKPAHKVIKKTGETQIVEYSFQRKKEIIHEEARISLTKDNNILTIVRDISEKKATDALLNIRNNALASASNSILIVDAQLPNIPIIYCNEAFEKMTGYSQAEILGRDKSFLQNHDRDQKEIGIMENAIDKGETCHVILRNYRKDGTMFWNDITITPIYNEENKLTHFIGVHDDITEKVNEEKLKDQTRRILEMISVNQPIETIGNTIVEIVETHLKDCTASILLLKTKKKTLHKLVAPNIPKAYSKHIEGIPIGPNKASFGTASFLKKEVIVSNIETNLLWQDYKDVALKNGLKACWSFPIMSSSGQVLGTFNVYCPYPKKPLPREKDILLNLSHLTSIAIESHNSIISLRENKRELEVYSKELEKKVQERTEEVMTTVKKLVETNLNLEDQLMITKEAQKIASSSKALTSKIAKYFPKGLILVISKDLKVEFIEGEVLDSLNLRQLISEGKSIHDVPVFAKSRKGLILENILKTLSGQHLSFELKYNKRYFAINSAPLYDENNEIISALHVYNDITIQKETELNFQNAFKKEKELNDLKSRFVSIASHEFRTPLSAILTSAILIGKQNGDGKEKKREKYLEQIERNVTHLVVILTDFLSLSKLEEGKVVPIPERFDLIQFAKALVKETNVGLNRSQTITMSNGIEKLYVDLDPKFLRRILMNLLSNASKYSPTGSNVDLKISISSKNVMIQVIDQGIGIPEEEQSHLFQRFFRAKNAANIEGTGLGLNIVKNYTELMDGNIGFKSQLDKGTTFWVKFPIQEL